MPLRGETHGEERPLFVPPLKWAVKGSFCKQLAKATVKLARQ